MTENSQQPDPKPSRRLHIPPWVWIIIAFLIFFAVWIWFIWFASFHIPEVIVPPTSSIRDQGSP